MSEKDVKVEELVVSLVGMDEDSALALLRENDIRCRILSRDGVASGRRTSDFRKDRINLEIEDKKIISARVG